MSQNDWKVLKEKEGLSFWAQECTFHDNFLFSDPISSVVKCPFPCWYCQFDHPSKNVKEIKSKGFCFYSYYSISRVRSGGSGCQQEKARDEACVLQSKNFLDGLATSVLGSSWAPRKCLLTGCYQCYSLQESMYSKSTELYFFGPKWALRECLL